VLDARHWDAIRLVAGGALAAELPFEDVLCLTHLTQLGLVQHQAQIAVIVHAAVEEAATAAHGALQAQPSLASADATSSTLRLQWGCVQDRWAATSLRGVQALHLVAALLSQPLATCFLLVLLAVDAMFISPFMQCSLSLVRD
jgi:hypothetical protein